MIETKTWKMFPYKLELPPGDFFASDKNPGNCYGTYK